jgi:hypothetical protein
MQGHPLKQEKEISLMELVGKVSELCIYLIKKWYVILFAGVLGAVIGLGYAWLKPVKYISRVSFVVEDSKAGGGGGLAALAGQFGFDLGGGSGGVFSGENIILFLKSESLCRTILLTQYDSTGSQLLADKYAESNELKAKWSKDKKIGQINFAKYSDGNFPRLEDSLIQVITETILTKELEIGKPDKKASFIQVRVTTRDELLSKYFAERLVKIATDRYVESKTKFKALNVAKLQRRADSLGALLNNRTYSAAATQQSLIDVNPGLRIAPVAAEISTRDKTMNATIFAEVVKNLEMAKVVLGQETPTIQIVDQSNLPLKKEKVNKLNAVLAGGILTGLLCIALLLFIRWWKIQQNDVESVKRRDSSKLPADILVSN